MNEKPEPLRHFHAGLAYCHACDQTKIHPTFEEMQKVKDIFDDPKYWGNK